MTAAGSTTYTFDGEGNRVKKSSGSLYWYGGGGSVLAETDTSGNTTNEYVFMGGARIARRDGSGNVYYYFANHLGSSAAVTNATGTICYDADFYLFGGELIFTNTCSQNYKFAGMERDAEDGLDHTLFRQYASNLGRWMSPDPADLAVAIRSNPQTWNRYSYALNNPVNLTDPRGTCPEVGEDGNCFDPMSEGLQNYLTNTVGAGDPSASGPNATPGAPASAASGFSTPPSGSIASSWWNAAQASYNGGPPSFNPVTAGNSWMAQNTGIYNDNGTRTPGTGFLWGSCAPTGLSNSCSPGNYALGSGTNLGYTYVTNQVECDYGGGTDCSKGNNGTIPDPIFVNLVKTQQAAAPSVAKPSKPCSAAIGPLMSQWAKALSAWTKAHPGQVPPPSVATPPIVNGAC
jgi:RHS repeat-associated protein